MRIWFLLLACLSWSVAARAQGWPEPKVIVRFWIITVVLVLIGLASLKIR